MKKSVFTAITFLAFTFLMAAQAQTLEKILNDYYKAVGQEKLSSASSFCIKAKVSQMGMELPMDMKIKKPNKFRMEMDMQGQKMIQAFDGEKGWMIAPWISPDPQELTGDQLKQAMQQADVEGELYNYKKKGHSAEFIGKVNADGKEAYKIKLTASDGTVKDYFIDANTNMVIKVKAKVSAMGQTVDVETRMMDYRKIDGVMMAMKIESESPMGTAVITMEEVKFNENIDDAVFAQPAK